MVKPLTIILILVVATSASTLVAQPISSPTEFRAQPFDVQHYDLEMTVRTPASKYADGHVDIHVLWTEDLAEPSFPFHARGIAPDSVLLDGKPLTVTIIGDPSMDTFHYRAQLSRGVKAGTLDTITVYYSGSMTTEGGSGAWGGVWYEGQVLYALGVGFNNPNVSATQHWMPCYDHPSDKATFRGNFRVSRDLYCASVGSLEWVEIPRGDSIRSIVWSETHPTATYLLTFAIGAFEKLSLTDTGVPHEIYSLEGDTANSRKTYNLVPRITDLYTRLFGAYPFDKVGYVNTRRGAMEHQTLISLPTSIVAKADSTDLTLAHELMHMWFGDYVTPIDFRHAWLTEAFATYGASLWTEELYGWQAYLDSLRIEAAAYKKVATTVEGVMPLFDYPRESPSSNYPRTIYIKGQLVVSMMRAVAGDTAFFSALQGYLAKHAYGNASTEDMQQAMAPALGTYTNDFFDQWVYKKGWPQLALTMKPGPSAWTVHIQQVQHMSSQGWPVFTVLPLNIVYRDPITGELTDSMFVMTADSMSLDIESPADFAINSGSKCRSLIDVVSVTTVNEPFIDAYGFTITPNPAFDSARIARFNTDEPALLEVYDAAGRNVYSVMLMQNETEIGVDISSWPVGSYTIQMITRDWASALPLLIVR